jgi:16S rRNA G966 N2-methylase RsmD
VTEGGVHYTPLPYPMIFKMLAQLQLKETDVFVDVGAGKGRVTCCVSRTAIARVVAIEVNEELLQQTIKNGKVVRGRRTSIDPLLISAADYSYSDATVIYLYNPFNGPIVKEVLDSLSRSYYQRPRPMRIVYANPVHEELFDSCEWMMKYDEWPADAFPVFGYRVSFWRNEIWTSE